MTNFVDDVKTKTYGPVITPPVRARKMLSEDEIHKELNKHCEQLMEHFDTVHIFVTKMVDEDTYDANLGHGNVLARKEQCREWIIRLDEKIRIDAGK